MHSTMEEDNKDEIENNNSEDDEVAKDSTSPEADEQAAAQTTPKTSSLPLNPSDTTFSPSASASPEPIPEAAFSSNQHKSPVHVHNNVFFVDTIGVTSSMTQIARPKVRSPSPARSDSSDEVVFHGRSTAQTRVVDDPITSQRGESSTESTKKSTDVVQRENSWDDTAVEWVHRSKPGIGWSVPKVKQKTAPSQQFLTFPTSKEDHETSEDAAVDDYLENLQQHDPEFLQSIEFASRDLDVDLEDGGHVQQKFESLSVSAGKKQGKIFVPREELRGVVESSDEDESDGLEHTDVVSSDDDDLDDEDDEGADDDLTATMDDETLALLLSKQEELGIASDELLLYDDGVDASVARAAKRYEKDTPKKSRRSGHFPSATLMADVLDEDPYGGFDVMDFERPSLRKKKGKKLPFDVSDDELRETIEANWENDRSKKKERKQEREELRAQGLLGSKSVANKYGEGMTIWEIGKAFETFLDSDDMEKSFPPMDKRRRKMIHEIATEFNCKTKSIGAGNSRFTKLIKTKSTTEYLEHRFVARARRINMGFFPRTDATKGKKALRMAGHGGGGNSAGVRYRDGDIVGGAAPEIGVENRGRAMLEKMGWSSGMALGAMDNKGILRPIEHVVKNTKTGLG